jgi:hypothetical protein
MKKHKIIDYNRERIYRDKKIRYKKGDVLLAYLNYFGQEKILCQAITKSKQEVYVKILTGKYQGRTGVFGTSNVIKKVTKYYPEYLI